MSETHARERCVPICASQFVKHSHIASSFLTCYAESETETIIPNDRCTTCSRDQTLDITVSTSFDNCKRHIPIHHLSDVRLDDSVVCSCMQATRDGGVDFAEVCCTSDSLLSGAVTSHGGRAVQYSHKHGFDLTTKTGTETLKGDLVEMKPRDAWQTPPGTTRSTHQSQSISRFYVIQVKILKVFPWLVEKNWCETILEQMWGLTSLGRDGTFSDL